MRQATIPILLLTLLLPQIAAGAVTEGEALRARADQLFDAEKWPEARDAYIRYLESHPKDVNARADLGVCYRNLGQMQNALKELDRALAIQPEHWQSLYNKVIVLGFDLGKKPEAGKVLAKLQALQPENPDVQKLAEALGPPAPVRTSPELVVQSYYAAMAAGQYSKAAGSHAPRSPGKIPQPAAPPGRGHGRNGPGQETAGLLSRRAGCRGAEKALPRRVSGDLSPRSHRGESGS